MSAFSQPIKPNNDGSIRSSIDSNGDVHLQKVWDASAAKIEQERVELNIANNATAIHARVTQEPEQLSF